MTDRRRRFIPLFVAAAIVVATALCAPAFAAGKSGKRSFISVMNGGQVMPPSSSNAFGVGYFTFDETTKQLCYSLSFSGLQGTETQAHLHSTPAEVVDFDLPLGSPKIDCVGPLSRPQEKLLRRGACFVLIETDLFQAGEIRGQIVPAPTVR
jgi:hypothetical protein